MGKLRSNLKTVCFFQVGLSVLVAFCDVRSYP